MSKLILGTNVVAMDEPAWSLKEINGPAPDSKSVRRWQVIKVVRNDCLVEFRRDLGLAKRYAANEFLIPGGVLTDEATGRAEILHTVGELYDIAELLRSDVYERPERPEGIDLIQHYRDRPEKQQRRRRKLSQFGPMFKIERG